MAKHNVKGAVYGITAALVFTALALPAAASPLLLNIGEAQSAAVSDETFGLGYDLEAMIITTVEQDQRSPYANKGICVADEFTGVMAKPDESSELVGKLYKDAGCEILEAKDGWSKVKSGSCEGFVASQKLITGVEAEEYALEKGVTQLVVKAQENGQEITLYAEPSSSSNVVATVKDAQSVTVVSQMADNGWTEVSIGSNKGFLKNASVVFDVKYDTAVSVEEVFCQIIKGLLVSEIIFVSNAGLCVIGNKGIEANGLKKEFSPRNKFGIKVLQKGITQPAGGTGALHPGAIIAKAPCGIGRKLAGLVVQKAHHLRRRALLWAENPGGALLAIERIIDIGGNGEADISKRLDSRQRLQHSPAGIDGGAAAKAHDDMPGAICHGIGHKLPHAITGGRHRVPFFRAKQRKANCFRHLQHGRLPFQKIAGRNASH